mmetsp:Transcript_6948/g.26787  ORF Transcript_6948/g.26787 Transcript_6948/m.26787 type:complete len:381 (-) Transcript_6948:260-1402(-)
MLPDAEVVDVASPGLGLVDGAGPEASEDVLPSLRPERRRPRGLPQALAHGRHAKDVPWLYKPQNVFQRILELEENLTDRLRLLRLAGGPGSRAVHTYFLVSLEMVARGHAGIRPIEARGVLEGLRAHGEGDLVIGVAAVVNQVHERVLAARSPVRVHRAGVGGRVHLALIAHGVLHLQLPDIGRVLEAAAPPHGLLLHLPGRLGVAAGRGAAHHPDLHAGRRRVRRHLRGGREGSVQAVLQVLDLAVVLFQLVDGDSQDARAVGGLEARAGLVQQFEESRKAIAHQLAAELRAVLLPPIRSGFRGPAALLFHHDMPLLLLGHGAEVGLEEALEELRVHGVGLHADRLRNRRPAHVLGELVNCVTLHGPAKCGSLPRRPLA